MAIQLISVGTTADDGKGDTLRVAMQKINDNTQELYGLLGQDTAGAKGIDISGSTIATTETNADITLSPNGTGNIVLGAVTVSGTTLSSADSSTLNINENLVVDGNLDVTGTITGTFSTSSIGDITAVGSTLITPSNADLTLSPGGSGAVVLPGITLNDNNITGTRSNDDINITPSGTGNVNLNGDTVRIGDADANATLTTQGTGDLILSTNSGTNSGTLTLADGTNGDITLEPDGTGDVLLKGNRVGIGTVNQPDTLLHLKSTNSVITLQRTNDANTPGLSFQQSGGNVRGVIKLDGTSGTSNEIFMQTFDGSSLAERFRVQHTGAKVSGTLNVDDGVTITDNTIKASASNADLELDGSGSGVVKILADATVVGTLSTANITNTNNITTTQLDADGVRVKDNLITSIASNANLELSAAGTGVVTTDTNFTLLSGTPFLKIQRTDNANVPGIDFVGQAGTSGSKILFDGTSGTANELIFQTFTVAGGMAEAFRVQGSGAKVTGTLDVDGGISITDNTITSSASNADLELNASGTGTIVLENLKIGTSGSTVTTILDEDNMSSDSATALATQQSIKAYVDNQLTAEDLDIVADDSSAIAIDLDTEILQISGGANITTKATGNTITASLDTALTGLTSITIDGLTISDNNITGTRSNDDINIVPAGTGAVVMPGITINDNNITGTRSNDNIIIDPAGTGNVIIPTDKITLGTNAAAGTEGVAIGKGTAGVGTGGVGVGLNAGNSSQGSHTVAVGEQAGETSQGVYAVAVGMQAGETSQGATGVAIGYSAGKTNQGADAVAIGQNAGLTGQGDYGIGIGEFAGSTNQGTNAIAIGEAAGKTDQAANSIVINASGSELNNTTASSFVVKPIRNASGTHSLEYNPTTGEVSYDTLAGDTGGINFSGNTITSDSNADIEIQPGGTGAVVMPGITIDDNTITSNRSNDNLILDASGTGIVSVSGDLDVGGDLKANSISAPDSAAVTINDTLIVNGAIFSGDSSAIQFGGVFSDFPINEGLPTTQTVGITVTGMLTAIGGIDVREGQDITIGRNGRIKGGDYTNTLDDAVGVRIENTGIKDNKILTFDSNANLELDANGTGGIIAQAPFTFNAGYIEKINTLTSSSTITVNCALASIHTVTLTTSTEFNITSLPTGGSVTLIITQDGSGSRTATFGTDSSTAVKFPGGAPTLSTGAGDIDVVTIINDGTNFLGNCAKDYS